MPDINITPAMAHAATNVEAFLDRGRSLPAYIFRENWQAFYFFDPDWIFSPEFVDAIQRALLTEASECACIKDLESRVPEATTFWMNADTIADEYLTAWRSLPIDVGPAILSCYGCTSERGLFYLYADMRAEVGLFAVRDPSLLEKFKPSIDLVQAVPIHTCSFGYMLPEWREGLKNNYGHLFRA